MWHILWCHHHHWISCKVLLWVSCIESATIQESLSCGPRQSFRACIGWRPAARGHFWPCQSTKCVELLKVHHSWTLQDWSHEQCRMGATVAYEGHVHNTISELDDKLWDVMWGLWSWGNTLLRWRYVSTSGYWSVIKEFCCRIHLASRSNWWKARSQHHTTSQTELLPLCMHNLVVEKIACWCYSSVWRACMMSSVAYTILFSAKWCD